MPCNSEIIEELRQAEQEGKLSNQGNNTCPPNKTKTNACKEYSEPTRDLCLERTGLYELLIDQMPCGVFIYDPFSCEVTYANPAVNEILMHNDKEHRDLYLAIHPYDKTEVRTKINELIGGCVDSIVVDVRMAVNDSYQWMTLSSWMASVNGKRVVVGNLFDISEIKKAQEKIEEQNKQLRKLDELKMNFLHITSHELRTPIASIKGYSQMMSKGALGEVTAEQQKAISVILKNTTRLNRLIEDMLDISYLQSKTMKFVPSKTDVNQILDLAINKLKTDADERGVKINTNLTEDVPEIQADVEKVSTALYHLIRNAITFSPIDGTVYVRVKKEKNQVQFEVEDKGIGIPKQKLQEIFNSFYQVDYNLDRSYGGAGLGLAVSKGIINAHGGKIWAKSEEGKGSTFFFTLPEEMKEVVLQQSQRKDSLCIEQDGRYYPELSKCLLE